MKLHVFTTLHHTMSASLTVDRANRLLKTLTPEEAAGIALLEIECIDGGPITSSILVPGCIDVKASGAMARAVELLEGALRERIPLDKVPGCHVLEEENFPKIRRHLLAAS